MKRIVTGSCMKNDGFVIITEKSLEDLAALMCMQYVKVQVEIDHPAEDWFVPLDWSDERINEEKRDPQYRHYYQVFFCDYEEEVFLYEAVCW